VVCSRSILWRYIYLGAIMVARQCDDTLSGYKLLYNRATVYGLCPFMAGWLLVTIWIIFRQGQVYYIRVTG